MTYTHEQLNDLRARVLAGQDVSIEEYAALIQSIRQRRSSDIEKSSAPKRAAKASAAASVELPDILKDL